MVAVVRLGHSPTVVPLYVPTPSAPAAGPSIYSDSISEISTGLDSTSAVSTLVSSIAETTTASDTTPATAIFGSTVSEGVTTVDVPSGTEQVVTTNSETITTSDSSSVTVTSSVSVSETIALSDLTDAALLGAGVVYNVSVSEVILITDAFLSDTQATVGGKRKWGEIPKKKHREIPVDSSNIKSVVYDKHSNELVVNFHNDLSYSYSDVGEHKVKNLIRAKSSGRYLNNNIVGNYFTRRIK